MSLMPKVLIKRIIRDSYSVSPVTGFMRTEMEVGPARQRRIASAMPTNVTFKMLLEKEELSVLEAWYKHTLQNGAAWFSMPIDSGVGYEYNDARFTDSYSVSVTAYGLYEVDCQVECRELATKTERDIQEYLDGTTPSKALSYSVIDCGSVTERVSEVINLG